jgi:inositol oxygenase
MNNPIYNTNNGIYKDGCGLSNCVFSYGHDEYLYDVLTYNKELGNVSNEFPELGYQIIRYHSLYPWHFYGDYTNFENEKDKEIKKYVQMFNKYDLYTKSNNLLNIEELDNYYLTLIKRYFVNEILVF